jgi:8-oxo-dGTP pyrophosphatase MutT (NUDIX family)
MGTDPDASYSRVRVLCLRDGALLLVQHRWVDGSYFWMVPGGGIKEGEGIDEAAVREVWEEAGVRIRVVRRLERPPGITGMGPEQALVLAEPLDRETRGPQPAPDGERVYAVEWHPITDERPIGGLTTAFWAPLGELLRTLLRDPAV